MHSDHQCKWCKIRLRPVRLRWFELPLLLIMFRPYQCPHCFERQYRPFWVSR